MHDNFDILDSIDFPVFVLDVQSDGGFIYRKSNLANVKMSGMPADNIEGKSPSQLFPLRIQKTLVSNYNRAIRSRDTIQYEVLIPMSTGDRRLKTSLMPILDTKGDAHRLVGSSIDITEASERAEQEIAQDVNAHEILKESEQYVSMAAHDLRTPMRNVKLLAEMLRDDFVDHGDGKMKLIESLIDVAKRSSELLSEVLLYTKAKQSQRAVSSVFPFHTMCQNIVSALDPTESYEVSYPALNLCADNVTLHIIVRNLLDNALKHGDKENLKVQIELAKTEVGFLHITIQDNGVGHENPGTLFLQEGKFRADTGFGLLAIKQLILARGGSISADKAKSGSGVIIEFKFPGEVYNLETTRASDC